MFNYASMSRYYPIDSFLHRLDPRTKLLGLLLFLILLLVLSGPLALTAIGILTLGLTFLSRIPLRILWQGLKPLTFLILFSFVVNLLVPRGEFYWSLAFLRIYKDSLAIAGLMSLRIVLLVFLSNLLLTLTTAAMKLCDGFEALLKPLAHLGIPIHELAMMMSIALRFVPTILEEMDKIMKAQSSRGARFDSGSVWQRLQGYSSILVPLFLSSVRRAEDLALAMEARSYHGGQGRTRLHPLRFQKQDAIFALGLLIFALLALYLE